MKELSYFKALEVELKACFNYIEPDLANYKCYGPKFASLMQSTCVEFESSSRALIQHQDNTRTISSISDIKRHLLELFPKLEENEVFVSNLHLEIKPFENWGKGRLDWWGAYCDLKHNRIRHYPKANLMNVVRAMSALLIVTIYLAKFRDKKVKVNADSVFWMQGMPQFIIARYGDLPDA